MLNYRPGDGLAHRLDPRSKLAFQAGFAVAVFARPTPAWLAAMTALAKLTGRAPGKTRLSAIPYS